MTTVSTVSAPASRACARGRLLDFVEVGIVSSGPAPSRSLAPEGSAFPGVSQSQSPSYPDSYPRSILALDLGTSTGWALLTPERRIVSGTESFKPGRFEGGGMRFLRFRRWLAELKTTAEPIGAAYFEEVRRHAGVDAAHAYGGFLATLTAWCEHHQIPYAGVPVGTIKRHATGKGNSDKATMIAAAQARGFTPADDNEADALALLAWAMEQGPA